LCSLSIRQAVKQERNPTRRQQTIPVASPASFMAQGIAIMDVPNMVFQMLSLCTK
jgi:hypothetical protein